MIQQVKEQAESVVDHDVKVTLLASLNGYAPAIAIEFGRKVLYSNERPSFTELEEHVKRSKR